MAATLRAMNLCPAIASGARTNGTRRAVVASTTNERYLKCAPLPSLVAAAKGGIKTTTAALNGVQNGYQKRHFSGVPNMPPLPDTSRRHTGINMHPESVGNLIMPGNVVLKTTLAGKTKWQPTELEYGHFWMLRDLRQAEEKPILSNAELIPEKEARVFPPLSGLQCLDKTHPDTPIDIPSYWLRKNRTRDPSAQCTLVGIAFRDYGYNMLNEWLHPFQQAMQGNDRVETVRLNLNEGYINRYFLRGIVTSLMRRNTPPAELSSTWIYFATDIQEKFRDPLRAHNLLPGYVYLLDGIGRVRFAASGPASAEEVERLTELANELLLPTTQHKPTKRAHRRS